MTKPKTKNMLRVVIGFNLSNGKRFEIGEIFEQGQIPDDDLVALLANDPPAVEGVSVLAEEVPDDSG